MHLSVSLIVLAAAVVGLAASPSLAQQNDPYRAVTPPRLEAAPPVIIPSREYAKGVAALRAKNYRQAIRSLGDVADARPRDPSVWRGLGAAYAGEQRWRQSRRAYQRAVYLNPDEVVGHAGLGLALQALNDPRAQQEAAWLKARAAAYNDTCPDAPLLKTLETSGPFAAPQAG